MTLEEAAKRYTEAQDEYDEAVDTLSVLHSETSKAGLRKSVAELALDEARDALMAAALGAA